MIYQGKESLIKRMIEAVMANQEGEAIEIYCCEKCSGKVKGLSRKLIQTQHQV